MATATSVYWEHCYEALRLTVFLKNMELEEGSPIKGL